MKQKQSKRREIKKYIPEFIIGFTLLTILISFILIYLIDLQNFAGIRDVLFDLDQRYFFFEFHPFIFHNWYRNGGIAEIFQWLFLGISALISAYIAGKKQGKQHRVCLFWGIMATAFMFMLIEDAGDPRHTIRSYVQAVYQEPIQGTMGSITEFIYFSVLAFIPTFALLKYGRVLSEVPQSLFYTISGFLFYALATTLSFLGDAINLYHRAGGFLYDLLLQLGDNKLAVIWQNYNTRQGWGFIEFFLMDSLLEEVLELLGAAALLAATLTFLLNYWGQPEEVNRQ